MTVASWYPLAKLKNLSSLLSKLILKSGSLSPVMDEESDGFIWFSVNQITSFFKRL